VDCFEWFAKGKGWLKSGCFGFWLLLKKSTAGNAHCPEFHDCFMLLACLFACFSMVFYEVKGGFATLRRQAQNPRTIDADKLTHTD